jgi:EAL domain-containing protein (putative c-di-GMP-specific phosphodiesterase class I)
VEHPGQFWIGTYAFRWSVFGWRQQAIISKMGVLKAHGIHFSLDDFGTGYSSLTYLKHLPLDQLKIDQGFVRNIVTDTNDAAIAKMVVALADSMGLSVIAEGVELQAQVDLLAHMGCHAYQGYMFSKPVTLSDFEMLARSQTINTGLVLLTKYDSAI